MFPFNRVCLNLFPKFCNHRCIELENSLHKIHFPITHFNIPAPFSNIYWFQSLINHDWSNWTWLVLLHCEFLNYVILFKLWSNTTTIGEHNKLTRIQNNVMHSMNEFDLFLKFDFKLKTRCHQNKKLRNFVHKMKDQLGVISNNYHFKLLCFSNLD